MESQKKRTSNFTNDEKTVLTELVLKYQNIVENKRSDATTNSEKLKGWLRLTEEFNTVSTYCHRSHTVLKCCWENIKRQTKKNRAERKKKLFMTGGGKPPSPPPSKGTEEIVEAVLGPALEGIPNVYDSDAVINEIIELHSLEEKTHVFEDDTASAGTSKEHNENSIFIKMSAVESKKDLLSNEDDTHKSTSTKGILKENNENDFTWNAWTPKALKAPVSDPLRMKKKNEEDWLKRRRPKNECLSDILTTEKIQLVKILQENANIESNIRLAILEEQLKQEKIKTQKLIDS